MKIENQTFQKERSLYNIRNSEIIGCTFSGEEDGESPLKECQDILLKDSKCDLRYACWHDNGISIYNTTFSNLCRAPLWYSKNINLNSCKVNSVKSLRECQDIIIDKSEIISTEFSWRCKNIFINDTLVEGEYAFFESKNIKLNKVNFTGKYSFQYVKNLQIDNSKFNTKDAFWHAKNVIVKNSTIKGEYIGWYSNNVTLINCKIESHQPFCYCKNLKIVDCEFINSDLAFEYSNVSATIKGKIDSIKNPKSGCIIVDEVGQIIKDDDKYNGHATIKVLKS